MAIYYLCPAGADVCVPMLGDRIVDLPYVKISEVVTLRYWTICSAGYCSKGELDVCRRGLTFGL